MQQLKTQDNEAAKKVQTITEPAHDKTYNETCATTEDSDQPAYLCSQIRVFADEMCLLWPPGFPTRDTPARWLSGRVSALLPGGCWFNPQLGHTKDFKNGTSCSFAWCSA